jgi:D-alanyl-D-alanine carboxypeptidase (penicillin-binding protein 5/6)
MPRGSTDRVLARIVYRGPVRAPVEKDQPIGTLRVWRGDNVVLEVPLHAGESVAKGGMTRRALDAATEFVIGLFLSGNKRI